MGLMNAKFQSLLVNFQLLSTCMLDLRLAAQFLMLESRILI